MSNRQRQGLRMRMRDWLSATLSASIVAAGVLYVIGPTDTGIQLSVAESTQAPESGHDLVPVHHTTSASTWEPTLARLPEAGSATAAVVSTAVVAGRRTAETKSTTRSNKSPKSSNKNTKPGKSAKPNKPNKPNKPTKPSRPSRPGGWGPKKPGKPKPVKYKQTVYGEIRSSVHVKKATLRIEGVSKGVRGERAVINLPKSGTYRANLKLPAGTYTFTVSVKVGNRTKHQTATVKVVNNKAYQVSINVRAKGFFTMLPISTY